MLNELFLFFEPLFLNIDGFWKLLFLLMFGHYLADYSLQTAAMQQAKNATKNPKEIWLPVMFGHCFIHAGFVFIITGKLWLALYELTVHFIVDDLKCRGKLDDGAFAFAKDQVLHIVDLVIIAVLFYVI